MAATLAAYDSTITFRRGASHGLLDALSRRLDYLPPPLPSLPILSLASVGPIFPLPPLIGSAVLVSPTDPLLPEVAAAQAGDATLSALIHSLQGGPGGESNPALPGGRPSGRSEVEQFHLHNGLLYSQGRLLIPPGSAALILKILQQYHDGPLAGHYGVARTQALVAQYFLWPGLATAVASYVRSCDACERNKVVRHAPYGLLSPLPIPIRPWLSVSLD